MDKVLVSLLVINVIFFVFMLQCLVVQGVSNQQRVVKKVRQQVVDQEMDPKISGHVHNDLLHPSVPVTSQKKRHWSMALLPSETLYSYVGFSVFGHLFFCCWHMVGFKPYFYLDSWQSYQRHQYDFGKHLLKIVMAVVI